MARSDVTLHHICEGGIYDHLGGGFSRYSVDERWLAPHFEKMLYDNAQLLELLAIAPSSQWQTALPPARATETVAWLIREMVTGEGAFSASLDADSEGEEGKFYIWSYDEVIEVLGADDGPFFARHYDVTPAGNFEASQHSQSPREPAAQRGRRNTLWQPSAQSCLQRARTAYARASTTRCLPTGTG